jgi:CTP:molybdopterin cytidylyltransferase MocA
MSPPDAQASHGAPFTAVVLAAQRAGRVDPLAAGAGVANKSLVDIQGAPLIRHVIDALLATPGLSRVRVVVEPQSEAEIAAILPRGAPVGFVVAADNLADSVYAAAVGVGEPMLITTSDNVLLTPGAARAVLAPLAQGADVAVALCTQASVLAAHPEGQRRFYRFSDDAYSNCNLYALRGPEAMRVAEGFRSGGQFAKKPLRMIVALGPINLALLLMRRLSLRGALRRLGRRFRLNVEPVILADGAHAIDVDNARTYRCAETLLALRRQALAA